MIAGQTRLQNRRVQQAWQPLQPKIIQLSVSQQKQQSQILSRCIVLNAKKVSGFIKLNIPAGKANPAPPVGPALGSKGVNIMAFCKEYNAATADKMGQVIPVIITVYEDRTFSFIQKTPPTSKLILEKTGLPKGGQNGWKKIVGKLTQKQLYEIAATKLPDLNTQNIHAAARTVQGTAKQMGIDIDPYEYDSNGKPVCPIEMPA